MSSLKRPFHDQAPGPKRSAWQLPASCDFCRLKKIRCDKKRPCSSCKDRDTVCEYSEGTRHQTFPRAHYDRLSCTSLEEDIQEIKDRLKRIEQLLLESSGPPKNLNPRDIDSLAVTLPPQFNTTYLETDHQKWDDLESIAASSQPEEMWDSQSGNESLLSTAGTTIAGPAELSRASWLSPAHGLGLDTETSTCWKETALQNILQTDEIFSSSLISLQSVLIIMSLLWDSEGQSKRYHTLKGLAYAKATQMGIHNIDAERPNVEPNPLEREMKRRLWWHLTCADWLLGSAPGPQHGSYIISPYHMTVNHPANIEDEGVALEGNPAAPRPDYHLTSMSFFRYRIKFAHLCREAMDTIQQAKTTRPLQPIYPLILDISNRYMSFLDELPWFFQLEGNEAKLAELVQERPYVTQQRAVLLYGIYSRLGRLHRPFVSQGISDPMFAASYKTGIECAEKLLRIRQVMPHGRLGIFGRSQSVDQHTFNAMLVLTIDVVAHPGLPDSERRRCEVTEICHLLKDKHTRPGQPSSGISRATQLLLKIVQAPHRQHAKEGIKDTAQIFSETAQTKDDQVPLNSYASLAPDELTREDASSQMAWSDECFSYHGQSINALFGELRESLSGQSNGSWQGYFNWEDLS
ncbi:transcriptional regulator family: Fungal Specific TF [Aspergillus niger]|nr:transcriptional regulator family: Fungal Specific TF [Aspergillus niger]KAI2905242.1 transcriptional regulator family: Fungal Specific TF [Aspergillus niger]KAI2926568.1 transcriptional regulator family: Fungal Specific TF [Aspergillus niger]KAI2942942.1 transcriptional regulator family: Fungal Specific TF [Aspergillus niger]KAI3049510.1 transcriptional regulator family: Fungal Specific TF [Aspergillus niger]